MLAQLLRRKSVDEGSTDAEATMGAPNRCGAAAHGAGMQLHLP